MIGVGDKVVCVDDSVHAPPDTIQFFSHPSGYVVKGQVYVISGIKMQDYRTGQELAFFILGKPKFWRGMEVPWIAFRFRKLEDHRMEQELKHYRELPQPDLIPG